MIVISTFFLSILLEYMQHLCVQSSASLGLQVAEMHPLSDDTNYSQ
jgi:hypothetical protein